MPNYYRDIHNQIPITKEMLWQQLKADYGVFDSDVIPQIKDRLKQLAEGIIENRVSGSKLGVRVITEYNLRKKINDLFIESITYEDIVDEQSLSTAQ